MALTSTITPMPIFGADGQRWVPFEHLPAPLKHLTRQQLSHRWGRAGKHGPAFPKPKVLAGIQYWSEAAVNEYCDSILNPHKYSIAAVQAKAAPKPKARAK